MRKTRRVSLLAEDRSAERGSVTIPLLLFAAVVCGAAFSTLSYAALWQSKVKLQLRLDRCVEGVALELVEIQNAIEFSNLRMTIERAAAAAAAVPTFGGSIEAAQPILAAEVAFQEAARGRWWFRQASWIGRRGCDGKSDLFLPLPNLKWSRPPSDTIGPQPLRWEGEDSRMEIRLWRSNRAATARVEKKGSNGKWNAKWIRGRPGFN